MVENDRQAKALFTNRLSIRLSVVKVLAVFTNKVFCSTSERKSILPQIISEFVEVSK